MLSGRLGTGIMAAAIVGTVVFGGMSILLLASKKEPKKVERLVRAESQGSSEKSTKPSSLEGRRRQEGSSKAKVKHRRLEEVEEARDTPLPKLRFPDDSPELPAPKLKDPELPTPKTDKSDLPAWKPDAALLDELAREVVIGQYAIRPPKGYQKATPPAELFPPPPEAARQEVFLWSREPRPDGTRDLFTVVIAAMRPEVKMQSLEEVLEDLTLVLQSKREKVKLQHDYGRISDIPFLRVRWNGVDPHSRESNGFTFTGHYDRDYIVITATELESVPEPRLKFAEAAALTFKKR